MPFCLRYISRLDGDHGRRNVGVRSGRRGIEAAGIGASGRNRRAGGEIRTELLRVSRRCGTCRGYIGRDGDEVNLVISGGGDEEDAVIRTECAGQWSGWRGGGGRGVELIALTERDVADRTSTAGLRKIERQLSGRCGCAGSVVGNKCYRCGSAR